MWRSLSWPLRRRHHSCQIVWLRGCIGMQGDVRSLCTKQDPHGSGTSQVELGKTLLTYKNQRMPYRFWQSPVNQRQFMDLLGKFLGYSRPSHWNQFQKQTLLQYGGRQLLKKHGNVYGILCAVYPEHEWTIRTVPSHVPSSHWLQRDQMREFLLGIVEHERLESPLEISEDMVIRYGGRRILKEASLSIPWLLDLFPDLSETLKTWSSLPKQRTLLRTIGDRLGVNSIDDWGNFTRKDLQRNGGPLLLHLHGGRYRDIFPVLYPDEDWKEVFNSRSNLSLVQQREIVHRVAANHQLADGAAWAALNRADLSRLGLNRVLRLHDSLWSMLRAVYPTQDWCPFDFSSDQLPLGFWGCIANQRQFLEYVAKNMSIHSLSDWKRVTLDDIRAHRGGAMIRQHGSVFLMLRHIYPEENWGKILQRHPRNYFQDLDHCREFFDHLVSELELSSAKMLLFLRPDVISSYGGSSLLASFEQHLRQAYPNMDFQLSLEEQREALERIQQTYFPHFKTLDDWLDVNVTSLKEYGGGALLQYHENYFDMLKALYPSHSWNFFPKRLPSGFWDSWDNIFQFLSSMERHYSIQQPSDWYRVSTHQIVQHGGSGLLARYKLGQVLQKRYPNEKWDLEQFSRKDKRARQRWMFLLVQQLYPHAEVIEEFSHPHDAESQRQVQLDVYVPELKIAFEYQGEHHFEENPAFGSVELYQNRDAEKARWCQEQGITLVYVPHWWDNQISTLQDLVTKRTQLISKE